MGVKRKGNPYFQAQRTVITKGARKGRETTVYRLAPGGFTLPKAPVPTPIGRTGVLAPKRPTATEPTPQRQPLTRWGRVRAAFRAMRAWYASVGVEPEPKGATAPVQRTLTERQRIREAYTAWLIAHGYDPVTERDGDGFNPWGGHPLLTQDENNLVHPLTLKPWNPNGFNQDDTYGNTGEYYDSDDESGADRRGFMRPNEKGERIHIGTGTVFDLGRPPRTWDDEDAPTYWSKHVEWRTPEVEAEIAESKRQQAEAQARIDAWVALERKAQRMGLAA